MKYFEKFNRYVFEQEQVEEALGSCNKTSFSILLAHNPVYFAQYAAWGADLTLSGHLHGGIIRIPLIPDCNDSDNDISLLAEFLNKNTGRYRYAEIMPYHNLGTGKSEKLGKIPKYIHENASEAEISRWCALFRQHKTDIRVSV